MRVEVISPLKTLAAWSKWMATPPLVNGVGVDGPIELNGSSQAAGLGIPQREMSTTTTTRMITITRTVTIVLF